jgi:hypothetical protein
MSYHRPVALTYLCWLIIAASFVTLPLAIGGFAGTDPEFSDWREIHRGPAMMLLALAAASVALGPLAAYFMLRAQNWARWLYAILIVLDLAVTSFLFARGELFSLLPFIRAAVTAPIVIVVVFLSASNRYFAAGGRPWWRLQEDDDGK